MPGNAKKESGRAKKAANEDKKAAEAAARAEAEEASRWDDAAGKKGKSASEKKADKAAEAAKKAEEKKRLEAEDEANTPAAKPSVSAGKGKAGGRKGPAAKPGAGGLDDAIASFSASNLDDALDAMSLVNERTDNASRGAAAGQIERHPERRFKAAFEAYKERELPRIKEEHKGLRLQQYHDLLYKQFQKHPDNPFNQLTVSYDASKEDKLAALESKRSQAEKRLRDA
ncbi:DUF1014-domain-containing protein [Testicularia cyperi]|uniref:DUF1014-domain-containing protein n=1 Tax=Testicularia cyperi TaxID=1882483 RepID=A0A317XJ89_9BASI|nr:DUF1014-domain-containing protein [Testicularia cyperi]